MKRLVTLIAAILFSLSVFSQRTFIRHFGGSESDYGTAITLTDSAGFLIGQTIQRTNDVYAGLTRTDANGNKLWSRIYKFRDITVIRSIRKWKNGYIVLASTFDVNSNNMKCILFRVDNAGLLSWVKEYSVSNSDNACGLSVCGDHFYLTWTADYNSPAVYPKIFWLKTDTLGNPEISKMFSAPYMITPRASAINSLGKTGIACESNSFGIGSFNFQNTVILQIDSMGNIEWNISLGTLYDEQVWGMTSTEKEWIVTGLSYFINSNADQYIFRTDTTGHLVSAFFYDAGTSQGEAGRAIIPDSDGGFVVAGDAGTFDERNMYLMKVNTNGDINWSKQYPVSTLFTNYPFDLQKLSGDSGYVFTGDLRPLSYYRDAALFRTDTTGNINCFTQPISFSKRADTVEVLQVNLQVVPHTLSVNNIQVQEVLQPVFERVICEFTSADFTFLSDTLCPKLCFSFNDNSIHAQSWQWSFPGGEPAFSSDQFPPPVCYDSAGIYSVTLTVTGQSGSNSVTKTLSLESFCDSTFNPDSLFIPNVITPNGDFKNDKFIIKNLPEKFNLKIYNRWGRLIFESGDNNKVWPGNTEDHPISEGAYYYLLTVEWPNGRRTYQGVISLLR